MALFVLYFANTPAFGDFAAAAAAATATCCAGCIEYMQHTCDDVQDSGRADPATLKHLRSIQDPAAHHIIQNQQSRQHFGVVSTAAPRRKHSRCCIATTTTATTTTTTSGAPTPRPHQERLALRVGLLIVVVVVVAVVWDSNLATLPFEQRYSPRLCGRRRRRRRACGARSRPRGLGDLSGAIAARTSHAPWRVPLLLLVGTTAAVVGRQFLSN